MCEVAARHPEAERVELWFEDEARIGQKGRTTHVWYQKGQRPRGLPEDLLRENRERCLTIPMANPRVRSLNLATSVAVVLYEALRQTGALPRPAPGRLG